MAPAFGAGWAQGLIKKCYEIETEKMRAKATSKLKRRGMHLMAPLKGI